MIHSTSDFLSLFPGFNDKFCLNQHISHERYNKRYDLKGNYMKNIIIMTLSMFAFSAEAAIQAEATGKITALRTQTNHHAVSASHGETIFKLSNGHDSACAWLSLASGNDTSVSFILSAQAQDREIKVWYYTDKKSAAWGTACKVANISFLGN